MFKNTNGDGSVYNTISNMKCIVSTMLVYYRQKKY